MVDSDVKSSGAYYTSPVVARTLASWAIRKAEDRVLDPSFGGGVFLEAASDRLHELGGDPSTVFGVERNRDAHAEAVARRVAPTDNLLHSDFFALASHDLPRMDAVVGNPPYIRFQRFKGPDRQRALARSAHAGVRLSGQASAWAPFLVCSLERLAPGGRLAMVLPAEVGHARYAQPVLTHLRNSFASCLFVAFDTPLFPRLSQRVVVLLADGRGHPFESFRSLQLTGADELAELGSHSGRSRGIDPEVLSSGSEKLQHQRIDLETLAAYRSLGGNPVVVRLGDVARVDLGYVSGANAFFHLSPAAAAARGIAGDQLQTALFRRPRVHGLSLTPEDWQGAARDGTAGYLLVPGEPPHGEAVGDYLAAGVRTGVPLGYKTSTRTPWYRVPGVRLPQAVLTPMATTTPALILCRGTVAPSNTLYAVDVATEFEARLAVGWLSSVTALSSELEGHALGGGLLKLEPREARAVLVPLPPTVGKRVLADIDTLLRRGDRPAARRMADDLTLGPMGFDRAYGDQFFEAAEILRKLRTEPGRS